VEPEESYIQASRESSCLIVKITKEPLIGSLEQTWSLLV
jgi:hypothetical protein